MWRGGGGGGGGDIKIGGLWYYLRTFGLWRGFRGKKYKKKKGKKRNGRKKELLLETEKKKRNPQRALIFLALFLHKVFPCLSPRGVPPRGT